MRPRLLVATAAAAIGMLALAPAMDRTPPDE
jgi:hypothetical protein